MHQIGNSFTRLSPSIDFSEHTQREQTLNPSHSAQTTQGDVAGDTGAPAAPDCLLGEPSKRFASIHNPALINAWQTRLQTVLADPVQLEQRRGHRRVSVLGSAIFDFDATGLLRVYGWMFDDNNRVMLEELPDAAVAIQGTPYQAVWMQSFQTGVLRRLQQSHPGQAALCQDYVAWAQRELAACLWTPEVQERVRYQVSVALDLDLWAVDIARQIQRSAQPRLPMRADVYNHAISHATDYRTLQQEAPQLIALYALLANDETACNRSPDQEVTAWMQHTVVADGLKPAMWRLLCQAGTGWMQPFLAYYRIEGSSCSEIALDLLTLAQAFGTEQLVPAWLLQAFIQLGGNPNAPSSAIAARLSDLFGFCKRLGHLAAQAKPATLVLLHERAHDIFDWASDHLKQLPPDYERRALVGGLVHRVEAQARRDAMSHQRHPAWVVPFQLSLAPSEVEAVILVSALAIWEEAQRMRHCADKYIPACRAGRWIMVSLRSPQHNRPLATLAYEVRSPHIRQCGIAGFANTLVTPEVLVMAQSCLHQLQAQRNRMKPLR